MINKNLDIHADDFGISKNSTDNIIELINNNYLTSISILPNMKNFDYAVSKLKTIDLTFVKISIHLNFMEGHCCSEKSLITDLVDENGYFTVTWKKLLLWNYNPLKYKKIQNQLEIEIESQIEKCLKNSLYINKKLRIDSHQHTHMIPIVYKALFNIIKKYEIKGIKTEFIRNSKEKLSVYFGQHLTNTFSLINIIKCIILNYFSISFQNLLKKNNLPNQYLCGVFFSGKMDFDRINKILPNYLNFVERKKLSLELLFHPGSVKSEEIDEDFVKPDFNIFHLSEGRKIEYKALVELNKNEY